MEVASRGFLALSLVLAGANAAVSQLYAELQVVPTDNATVGFFQCTAYKNQTYFLNHVMSWSKIGHDGKEKFLSLNWQLVQDASHPEYSISSNAYKVSNESSNFYFTLIKNDLTDDDHGEYICRLYDFDRNVMAERRIPVSIYKNGLTLEPHVLRAESSKASGIAVNCKRNTSDSTYEPNQRVIISHVTADGNTTKVASNGKLVDQSLSDKYEIINGTVEDFSQYILKIKNVTMADQGKIQCVIENDTSVISNISVVLTVDKPVLMITPKYFLKVPTDSYAKFQCMCDPRDTLSCDNYTMSWTFTDRYSGVTKDIYRNGSVVESPEIYKVKQGLGTSEFSIQGLVELVHEGTYTCILEDNRTGRALAEATVPVTVVPVSLGALAITENYPANVRLLCTVSGTQWNSHYLETHNLTWTVTKNGRAQRVSTNGELEEGFDKTRYSIYFDPKRYFVILDIKVLTQEDHGDYTCHLRNIAYNKIIKEETLRMYGKGAGTLFAGSYGV